MKKRTLSFLLALVLSLLPVTALAAGEAPTSWEEALENVSIKYDIGSTGDLETTNIENEWTHIYEDENGEKVTDTVTGYHAVRADTVFEVSHTGTQDDGSYINVNLGIYRNNGSGVYEQEDSLYLTSEDGFMPLPEMFDPDFQVKPIYAGQSVQFSLPTEEYGVDTYYRLEVEIYHPIPDHEGPMPLYTEWWYYYFCKVDEAGVAACLAGAAAGTTDTPATPAIPATGTAYASTQTVSIDGKAVTLEAYALKDANGNPTNYVKLRDVAYALNGTAAQFEVAWDGNVNIVTGKSYTANGSEMSTPFSGDRSYSVPTAVTKVNGVAADLAAISLTDDSGGGYTYYQLRDLGRALGFNVGWSAERGIFIETDKPYTDAD